MKMLRYLVVTILGISGVTLALMGEVFSPFLLCFLIFSVYTDIQTERILASHRKIIASQRLLINKTMDLLT